MPAIRRNWQLLVLATTTLWACTQTATPLNSERIRQAFGSYGVEILRADGQRRVSNLYSGSGPERICRTLAIVDFSNPLPTALATEHAAIEGGRSIGETFKNAGWRISKRRLQTDMVTQTEIDLPIAELMKIDADRSLAAYVYQFDIDRNGRQYTYARITEIYHPDYLTLDDLRRLSAAD